MFSTPQITNEEKNILHMEDISSELALESILGRKGLSLYNLYKFDVPVPEFFVISPQIFTDFVKKVFDEKGKELLKSNNPEPREILNLFHRYDFDTEIKKELLKVYTRLSGFSDAWVSVRSSVVFPQESTVSFSGVFVTLLNIRGFNDLLKSIKSVYASLFTDASVMYGVREGVDISEVKMAVVVQKMVHSEVSGTCFTLDPVTLNTTNMSIEAVYGLGDVIENGEITPDTYYLSKKNLEVYEKHISPQEWMKVRSLTQSKEGFEKIKISQSWSHRQKLDDRYIEEVAKISLLIEDKLNEHVDVEWALSGGRVYVLQTKPAYIKNNYLSHHIQYGGYSYVANNLKSVIEDFLGKKDAGIEMIENSMLEAKKLIEKESSQVIEKPKEEVVKEVVEQMGEKELTSGIGVSFGRVSGVAKHIKTGLEEVSKENILLFDNYNQTYSDLVMRSVGVVSKAGGLTSEVSLLSRDFQIPAVVGVDNLFDVIQDGDRIEIDGNTGSIYLKDKVKVEQREVVKDIVSRLEEVKEEEKIQIEPIDEAYTKELETLPKTATKLYIQSVGVNDIPSYSYSDGVFFVDLDSLIISYGKHPGKILDDGKYKEYAKDILSDTAKLAQKLNPKEVMIVIGTGTVGKYSKLVGGNKYEPEDIRVAARGAERLLKSKKSLDVSLRLIRRLRNINGCRNVSLGVFGPQSGFLMKELKKEISASGLRRGGSFKLYAIVSSPAEVILTEDILDSEIDGVVLDTPTVAKHMFNLPLEAKNNAYDLSVGSVLKILDTVVVSCKNKERKIIVVTEKNKDLIKYCISKGVHGLVIPYDSLKESRELVAQQETKLILSMK